eukprot:scaffold215298_cov27-Tisochrysis_lutea.AAC.4
MAGSMGAKGVGIGLAWDGSEYRAVHPRPPCALWKLNSAAPPVDFPKIDIEKMYLARQAIKNLDKG